MFIFFVLNVLIIKKGGSTYLASKINEAKDILTSSAEEEKKDPNETSDEKSSSLYERWVTEDRIREFKPSDKLLFDILFMKKTEYTESEIEELKKKYKELVDKEDEEYEKIASGMESNYDDYEYKEKKIEDWKLEDEIAKEVDKNSEFYKKYKDKIANMDFLDPLDIMNVERAKSFKIIKDKPKI